MGTYYASYGLTKFDDIKTPSEVDTGHMLPGFALEVNKYEFSILSFFYHLRGSTPTPPFICPLPCAALYRNANPQNNEVEEQTPPPSRKNRVNPSGP